MGEHEESGDEVKPETALQDWRRWMDQYLEIMESYRDFWRKSNDAGKEVSRIAERHIGKMAERLKDLRERDASIRELYRETARHCSAMTEEMMRSDAVLRLFAENLETFLDWRIAMQDSQQSYLKSVGLPTRDELTEMYRELHDLRKKVHEISKPNASGGRNSGQGK